MTLLRILALGTAIAVAGCSGTANRGVESVHQPVVTRAAYAFDVAAGTGGLAPGERARLAGWLETMRMRYGDEIGIDVLRFRVVAPGLAPEPVPRAGRAPARTAGMSTWWWLAALAVLGTVAVLLLR